MQDTARSPRRRSRLPAVGRPLEIRGPAFSLRYPRETDASALFRLASDPAVTEYFSWGPYELHDEALQWLRTLPARRETGSSLEFAIVAKSGEVIGITSLTEPSLRDRRALVGTWLGRAHWGSGANSASKALIAAIAFGPLRLERLSAYADARNLRSQRALERLGFQWEGTLRAFHRHYDSPRNVLSYSLLRSEWAASPLRETSAKITGLAPDAFLCDPPRSV